MAPSAHSLTGGQQLSAGPLSKSIGAHGDEHLMGDPQLATGVVPAILATQPLAIEEMGACKSNSHPGATKEAIASW